MACCRCNRTGFCKGCACVKAKKSCVNCLPGKLGNCANRSTATVMGSTNSHPEPLRDSNTTIATAATAATTATTTTSSGDEPPLCQPLEPDPPCPRLPDHPSVSVPAFTWGNLSGPDFAMTLDATYAEVVHWRRNCFTVPYGKGGKEFVRELSRLPGLWISLSTRSSDPKGRYSVPYTALAKTKQCLQDQKSHHMP